MCDFKSTYSRHSLYTLKILLSILNKSYSVHCRKLRKFVWKFSILYVMSSLYLSYRKDVRNHTLKWTNHGHLPKNLKKTSAMKSQTTMEERIRYVVLHHPEEVAPCDCLHSPPQRFQNLHRISIDVCSICIATRNGRVDENILDN